MEFNSPKTLIKSEKEEEKKTNYIQWQYMQLN